MGKGLDKFTANENTPKHKPKTQKARIVEVKKKGRPSDKIEGVEYVKLSARVPKELRRKIKLALLTTHSDHKTQDAFIIAAINEYLSGKK